MQEGTGALAGGKRREPHPVVFEVAYPEQLSRLTTFFRLILAIPQLVVTYALVLVLDVLTFFAWWAILFTGRYPRSMFELNVGFMRWTANVFAYLALLRDEYPPFSPDLGKYPVLLDVPPSNRQARWRLFIRAFSIIPNQIVFGFISIAWYVTTIVAWFAILITGRYPRGLHRFGSGMMRWYQRQQSYYLLLRDEYPPYSTSPYARPGNEALSAVIGAPIFAVYIAIYVLQFSSVFFAGGDTTSASLAPGAISRERPTVEAAGLRLTLTDFSRPTGTAVFDVEADTAWWNYQGFIPQVLNLESCGGELYFPERVDGQSFVWFWNSGTDNVTVTFSVPSNESLCELSYFRIGGSLVFEFE